MSDVAVVAEPRTYTPKGQHSYYRDQMLAAGLNGYSDPEARERLRRHAVEVSVEVDKNTAEGQRALTELMEDVRDDDRFVSREAVRKEARARLGRLAEQGEQRAATSSTIVGFTTPQWLTDQYAKFRGTQRAFADQCLSMPIPDVGLQINIPRFTGSASAGAQPEGSSVSSIELDPTGTDEAVAVQTIAGQVVASQQLLDRTQRQPHGPSFDLIILDELKQAYDQSLNQYALGQAISLGGTITGASAFTNNALDSFNADVAAAAEALTDTAGVRQMATHVFTTPDIYFYIARTLDAQKRPMILPTLAPGVPPQPIADSDAMDKWTQFTGSVVSGMIFWFVDPTIAANGTISPIVVSRPDKILLYEGTPVTRTYPQTIAQNLQIVTQLYSYTAVVPRYPGSTQTIYGSAYTTSLK